MRREQKISQAGFAKVQEMLVWAEANGYGSYECARIALTRVGLTADPNMEIVFVVDPSLVGSVFPFMEEDKK